MSYEKSKRYDPVNEYREVSLETEKCVDLVAFNRVDA